MNRGGLSRFSRRGERCDANRLDRRENGTVPLGGLMKTGTGSTTACTLVLPKMPPVVVPVPVFIAFSSAQPFGGPAIGSRNVARSYTTRVCERIGDCIDRGIARRGACCPIAVPISLRCRPAVARTAGAHVDRQDRQAGIESPDARRQPADRLLRTPAICGTCRN